jgi:hypothetical protein
MALLFKLFLKIIFRKSNDLQLSWSYFLDVTTGSVQISHDDNNPDLSNCASPDTNKVTVLTS